MSTLPLGEWSANQRSLQHLAMAEIILKSNRAWLRQQPANQAEVENRVAVLNDVLARMAILVAILEAAPDNDAELGEVADYDVKRGLPPQQPWNET